MWPLMDEGPRSAEALIIAPPRPSNAAAQLPSVSLTCAATSEFFFLEDNCGDGENCKHTGPLHLCHHCPPLGDRDPSIMPRPQSITQGSVWVKQSHSG